MTHVQVPGTAARGKGRVKIQAEPTSTPASPVTTHAAPEPHTAVREPFKVPIKHRFVVQSCRQVVNSDTVARPQPKRRVRALRVARLLTVQADPLEMGADVEHMTVEAYLKAFFDVQA